MRETKVWTKLVRRQLCHEVSTAAGSVHSSAAAAAAGREYRRQALYQETCSRRRDAHSRPSPKPLPFFYLVGHLLFRPPKRHNSPFFLFSLDLDFDLVPGVGSTRHCGTFHPRIKLPLAIHLCDPQDKGIVTAVIC